MSLKQECIDMINLIIKPLQDDDMDDYELEEDSYRDLCGKTGEDITYLSCWDCENYNKNCAHKLESVKVDVSFWNYGDCQKNYVFSKSAISRKGICIIRNRKQLMEEMFNLKQELEAYKDWNANFGIHYDEYLDYAKQFAQELKERYIFLGMVQTDILPIIFHTEYDLCDGKINYCKQGNLCILGKQNVINVFCCMEDAENTKRTIRHEILHYLLYIAGLKYQDDTAIFHYLCGEFDAHAYKEMDTIEQSLYEQLIDAIEKVKMIVTEQDYYNDLYTCMILAIGAYEDDSRYGFIAKNIKDLMQALTSIKKVS